MSPASKNTIFQPPGLIYTQRGVHAHPMLPILTFCSSKLPDNLKQLFRSVAMAVPDNALIAEVILSSEGFLNAKELGQKIVALFTLSKQLLSK